MGSGRTRVGGYWTRKCWRAGPRAAACASTAGWRVLRVAGWEENEWPQQQRRQQQQQRSGLQDVQSGDQNGCREMLVDVVVVVGGANLTVRTRRWVGPYKSRGCGARRRGFSGLWAFRSGLGWKGFQGRGIGFYFLMISRVFYFSPADMFGHSVSTGIGGRKMGRGN